MDWESFQFWRTIDSWSRGLDNNQNSLPNTRASEGGNILIIFVAIEALFFAGVAYLAISSEEGQFLRQDLGFSHVLGLPWHPALGILIAFSTIILFLALLETPVFGSAIAAIISYGWGILCLNWSYDVVWSVVLFVVVLLTHFIFEPSLDFVRRPELEFVSIMVVLLALLWPLGGLRYIEKLQVKGDCIKRMEADRAIARSFGIYPANYDDKGFMKRCYSSRSKAQN